MSANWEAAESAIWTWLKQVTALPDAQIFWADQNAEQPPNTFITLRMMNVIQIGTDYVIESVDLSAPEGQEIVQVVAALREFTLSMQAYSDAVTGNASARALLAKVATSLALETYRAVLLAGGLTAFDSGPVLNLSALAGTDFEGRASLDVRFYVSESLEARTGYIARATLIDKTGEPDSTLTVEVPTE